jgi:hypothetical protein
VEVVVYDDLTFGLIRLAAGAAGLVPFREGSEFPNPDFVAGRVRAGATVSAPPKPHELGANVQ